DFLCGSELLVMGQRHRSRKRCRRKLGRAGGYRSVPEIRAGHLVPDLSIMARQLYCRCYKMRRTALTAKDPAMHDVPGSHWHEPTAGRRAGFGKFGRPMTPYDLFMESEGIPVFRDIGVSRVQNLPLAPWKRLGGRGTYIQLHGTEGKWGCYVVE